MTYAPGRQLLPRNSKRNWLKAPIHCPDRSPLCDGAVSEREGLKASVLGRVMLLACLLSSRAGGHLSFPHSPLVCLGSGILLFAMTGETGRGRDVLKPIVPFQGANSQLGLVSTQLMINN